jgi:SAM-dependent methyltransferase
MATQQSSRRKKSKVTGPKRKVRTPVPSKYALYEASVQSPDVHAAWLDETYKAITKGTARNIREDFCGTFKMSCEWVKRHPKNTALGLDLDPEPLNYGRETHLAALTADQKSRVKLLQKNVLEATRTDVDLISAGNFSFYIFKQRELLVKYFKSCKTSLKKGGLLVLELAGGPGMIAPMREKKEVWLNRNEKFVYTWHQKSFDPITHDANYAIHFKLASGRVMLDQFVYDWRLWSIPEVRDALADAGFSKSIIYWETAHQGKGTGEYLPMEQGDNAFAWVSYVIGIK